MKLVIEIREIQDEFGNATPIVSPSLIANGPLFRDIDLKAMTGRFVELSKEIEERVKEFYLKTPQG